MTTEIITQVAPNRRGLLVQKVDGHLSIRVQKWDGSPLATEDHVVYLQPEERLHLIAALQEPRGGDCMTAHEGPIDPLHPTYCMRDCGCVKERGHDGKCDLTGPPPENGCECLACSLIESWSSGSTE